MCTNATSTDTSRTMALCTRLLPREWASSEAARLCGAVASQADADGVVKCALDSQRKLGLARTTAAELCRLDTKLNAVLDCALVGPRLY